MANIQMKRAKGSVELEEDRCLDLLGAYKNPKRTWHITAEGWNKLANHPSEKVRAAVQAHPNKFTDASDKSAK